MQYVFVLYRLSFRSHRVLQRKWVAVLGNYVPNVAFSKTIIAEGVALGRVEFIPSCLMNHKCVLIVKKPQIIIAIIHGSMHYQTGTHMNLDRML
jgi:hypothetical protein